MTEKTFTNPKPSGISIASSSKKAFRQYGGVLGRMVVLIILFSFVNDSLFTANNITDITLQVSVIAIAAYGTTYVLLLGDIDLSVGSTVTSIGVFAILGASWGIPFVLLVPLFIIAALALGVISGGLAVIVGVPSLIVIVATMRIFRDIAYIVIDGMPIMIKDDAFLALGDGEPPHILVPIWILIILLLVDHFILTKTTFGREVHITGNNKEAAVYSGINVTRLKIKVFMITVVLIGISGMILTLRLYSGQPSSVLSYELDTITATVLRGTSLNGGYGTVVGTATGALTIDVVSNGMNLMSTPYFYQMVVKGLVTFVVVYSDIRNKRKRS